MSKAWRFYVIRNKEEAECVKCQSKISTKGGSTKGLLTHLRTKHQIDVNAVALSKEKIASEDVSSQSDIPEVGTIKKRKIMTDYFKKEINSLEEVLARMVAKDGIPFSLFITSNDLRMALSARGFHLPSSSNTIRQKVMEFAETIEQNITEDLKRRRSVGERFSLTIDEWTGENNKRFANINVHMTDRSVHHLGLIRIIGSMNAESCVELVAQRVAYFGLNLLKDIICCTTDGASVMVKFGKIIECEQQLCYAHGVHLAVSDVFYTRPKLTQSILTDNVTEGDSSHDSEHETDADSSLLL